MVTSLDHYNLSVSTMVPIQSWLDCPSRSREADPGPARLTAEVANRDCEYLDMAEQLAGWIPVKEEAVEWARFMRRCLAWLPEDRPSAAELQLDGIFTGAFYHYPSSTNDAEQSDTDQALHVSKEEEMIRYILGCDLDDLHQPFDGSDRLKWNPPARPLEESRLLARIDDDLFELHDQTSSFVNFATVESDVGIHDMNPFAIPMMVEIEPEARDYDKDYNDKKTTTDDEDDDKVKHDESKKQAQDQEDQDRDRDENEEDEHDKIKCEVTEMTAEL